MSDHLLVISGDAPTCHTCSLNYYEIVKIEKKPNGKTGRPYFVITECKGRMGRILRARGFSTPQSESLQWGLPGSFCEVAQAVEAAGIKKGQRAIVRVNRTFPAGQIAYFCYSAT